MIKKILTIALFSYGTMYSFANNSITEKIKSNSSLNTVVQVTVNEDIPEFCSITITITRVVYDSFGRKLTTTSSATGTGTTCAEAEAVAMSSLLN